MIDRKSIFNKICFFVFLLLHSILIDASSAYVFSFGLEFNDFFQDARLKAQTSFVFQYAKQHRISLDIATRYAVTNQHFDCDTTLQYCYEILDQKLDTYLKSFFSAHYNFQQHTLQIKTWFEDYTRENLAFEDLTLKDLLWLNALYLGKEVKINMHDGSYTWALINNSGLATKKDFEESAREGDIKALAVHDIKSAIAIFLIISLNDKALMNQQWEKIIKSANAGFGANEKDEQRVIDKHIDKQSTGHSHQINFLSVKHSARLSVINYLVNRTFL